MVLLARTFTATLSPVSVLMANLTLAKVPSPTVLPSSYFPTLLVVDDIFSLLSHLTTITNYEKWRFEFEKMNEISCDQNPIFSKTSEFQTDNFRNWRKTRNWGKILTKWRVEKEERIILLRNSSGKNGAKRKKLGFWIWLIGDWDEMMSSGEIADERQEIGEKILLFSILLCVPKYSWIKKFYYY